VRITDTAHRGPNDGESGSPMIGMIGMRGVSLVQAALGLAVASLFVALAIPTVSRALQASHQERLAGTAQVLFAAIRHYEEDHGSPPPPGSKQPDGLNLRTLAPLSQAGYLVDTDEILSLLRDGRVTAYDCPESAGEAGFWILLVDRSRPEIQLLAAATDAFPLAPGQWLEGIYQIRGDRLVKLRDASLAPTHRTQSPLGLATERDDG